jgi:hypothetical protein
MGKANMGQHMADGNTTICNWPGHGHDGKQTSAPSLAYSVDSVDLPVVRILISRCDEGRKKGTVGVQHKKRGTHDYLVSPCLRMAAREGIEPSTK